MLSISISGTKVRVGAGGVAKLGLTEEQRTDAEDKFRQANDKRHVPDSAYLRINRNPILMPAYIVTQARQIMRFYKEKLTERFFQKKKLRPA